MPQKRVDLTDAQWAYMERAFGEDATTHSEMFRHLVREHRRQRELLDALAGVSGAQDQE